MRVRCPTSLVEHSMKLSVSMTLCALQKLNDNQDKPQDENNLLDDTESDESIPLASKRKLETESLSPLKKACHRRSSLGADGNPQLVRSLSGQSDNQQQQNVSKDDCYVENCFIVDTVIILRNYFNCLPQNLWNQFFSLVVREMNNLESSSKHSTIEVKTFELLFCKKVLSFSTHMVSAHVFDKCEQIIYDKLQLCRNLKKLEIHYNMSLNLCDNFLISLSRLNHLQSVTLLPDNTKHSFHSAILVLSKHCKSLQELTLTYDSEYMSELDNNIGLLQSCSKLRKLILHSFGRGAEAQFIITLLYRLKQLRCFFHRELPHAIIDIYSKCFEEGVKMVLNLRVLMLAVYCRGIGSQLCYLPDDSIVQIATVCPFLSHLKLLRPSNMSVIANLTPFLISLDLHDADIKESLSMCPVDKSLQNLSLLSFKNSEFIDYGDIQIISESCPYLQELEISHSNLYWSNELIPTNKIKKQAFPYLRKLTLVKVPHTEQTEPRFICSKKLYVDNVLLKYLLYNSCKLEELYLEFELDTVRCRDPQTVPNELDLIFSLSTCNQLKDLMLLSCSSVTFKVLERVIEKCPKLQHLWDIEQWQIAPEEMDKILRKFSYMFTQSQDSN